MPKKLEKNYVSDIDKLLQSFDEQYPEKTASQQAEISKHERIAKLRDGVQEQTHSETSSDKPIWDEF